jgi:hypothetical protein
MTVLHWLKVISSITFIILDSIKIKLLFCVARNQHLLHLVLSTYVAMDESLQSRPELHKAFHWDDATCCAGQDQENYLGDILSSLCFGKPSQCLQVYCRISRCSYVDLYYLRGIKPIY